MIDVVFLLLVFFMLSSRFGLDAALPLPLAAGGGAYSGPPRLIDVSPDGLALNGVDVVDLVAQITPLMTSPSDIVVLRGKQGASVQHIVSVTETLGRAGFTSVVLVE